MKCLSIREPWLELILRGEKTEEYRTWPTQYRGPLLLHASKKLDLDGFKLFDHMRRPWLNPLGAVRGICEVTGCRKLDALALPDIEPDMYGIQLSRVRRLSPFPVRGRLGLFEVEPPEVAKDQIEAWLGRARCDAVAGGES